MSNQYNSRLKPMVKVSQKAHNNSRITPKGYSLLMSALVTGALIAPAMAESNPNNVFSTTSTTTGTGSSGSSVNGASSTGLSTATNSTSFGGKASGVQAGNHEPPYGALPGEEASLGVVNEDVIEEAKSCADPNNPDGLKAEHDRVYKERINMAVIQTDTDKIFEKPAEGTEPGVAGCFTAGTEIIDLARSIPSITPSWGNIGTIVRKAVENRIKKAQAEIFERGCAIANKALAGAIAPINEQLSEIAKSNAIKDPTGFLGNYLANITGQTLDESDLAFNGVLDNIENKINEENKKAKDQLNEIGKTVNDLDNALDNIGGYDTSAIDKSANDAQNNALLANVQRAQSLYNEVMSRKPPKVSSYRDDRKTYYCKYVQGTTCTNISYGEYRNIQNQTRNWGYEHQSATERLNAAKSSLGKSSSTTSSINNYFAPTINSGESSVSGRKNTNSNVEKDHFASSNYTTNKPTKTNSFGSSSTTNKPTKTNSFGSSSTTNNPNNVFSN